MTAVIYFHISIHIVEFYGEKFRIIRVNIDCYSSTVNTRIYLWNAVCIEHWKKKMTIWIRLAQYLIQMNLLLLNIFPMSIFGRFICGKFICGKFIFGKFLFGNRLAWKSNYRIKNSFKSLIMRKPTNNLIIMIWYVKILHTNE